jgi:hypothetical protein
MESMKQRAPEEEKEESPATCADLTTRAQQVILENVDTLALLQSFASAHDKIAVFRLVSKTWAVATRTPGAWHSLCEDDGVLFRDKRSARTELAQPYLLAGVRHMRALPSDIIGFNKLNTANEIMRAFPNLLSLKYALLRASVNINNYPEGVHATMRRLEVIVVIVNRKATFADAVALFAAIPAVRDLCVRCATATPIVSVGLGTLAHLHTLTIDADANAMLSACLDADVRLEALESLKVTMRHRVEPRCLRVCPRLSYLMNVEWTVADLAEAPLCAPRLEYLAVQITGANKAAATQRATDRMVDHGASLRLRGLSLRKHNEEHTPLWQLVLGQSSLTIFEQTTRWSDTFDALASHAELRHVNCSDSTFASIRDTSNIRTMYWRIDRLAALDACPRLSTVYTDEMFDDDPFGEEEDLTPIACARHIDAVVMSPFACFDTRRALRVMRTAAGIVPAHLFLQGHHAAFFAASTLAAIGDTSLSVIDQCDDTYDFFVRAVRLDRLER